MKEPKNSKAVQAFNKLAYETSDRPYDPTTTGLVDAVVPSYNKDKVILALANRVKTTQETLSNVRDHRDRLLKREGDNDRVTRAMPIIMDAIRSNNI